MKELIEAFRRKGKEFSPILKMGGRSSRTPCDDARAGVQRLRRDPGGRVKALERIQNVLCEINMGATAIGTGLNAPKGYAKSARSTLQRSRASRSTSRRT